MKNIDVNKELSKQIKDLSKKVALLSKQLDSQEKAFSSALNGLSSKVSGAVRMAQKGASKVMDSIDEEDLMRKAKHIIKNANTASATSAAFLQKQLKVGYKTAAGLAQRLADTGMAMNKKAKSRRSAGKKRR